MSARENLLLYCIHKLSKPLTAVKKDDNTENKPILFFNLGGGLIVVPCVVIGLIQTSNSHKLEGSKSSTHYLGDKNRFDVSSKGPSSGISVK